MARCFRASHRLLLAGWLLALAAGASTAAVVYVNKNSTGAIHDGTSWSTAFLTVQAGVNVALSGDEVWIAASTPAAPAYVENVTIKDDIALYGGFVGTETARSERDWKVNVTILDGSGSPTADVVKSQFLSVVLNGFTVRNGYSGVSAGPTATITNCALNGNTYGIRVYPGTVSVSNCTISRNSSGVNVGSGGTANITNCTVSGSTYEGVEVGSGGVASVANSIISGNSTAGVYVTGTAAITNCISSGNSSDGIYVTGTATIANSTVAGNGYGIRLYGSVSKQPTATITNCIVAFNETGVYSNPASQSETFSHNDVYGNSTSNYNSGNLTGTNGNISQNPLVTNRVTGDFRLLPSSPCIDAGDDSVIAAGQRDADGRLRIIGAHVDVGAYEADVTDTYTLSDAASALAAEGGLSKVTPSDFGHLNADRGGISAGTVDMFDAVWIVRRAMGFDPA